MQRIVGLGGIFFKAKDPGLLYEWYEMHLGIKREPHGSAAKPSGPRHAESSGA